MDEIWCCPRCGASLSRDTGLRCSNPACPLSAQPFPMVRDQPVLVDFAHSILDRESLLARAGASQIRRKHSVAGLRRLLEGENQIASRIARDMLCRFSGQHVRLLVIGGGTIGSGAECLYAAKNIDLVGTDIYASEHTRIIADGHKLPFRSDSFDAVWIQAVLEHVLSPQSVVDEIHRVLKPDGLVFADTPFMQQVHEAAFDFTRFTPNGHRWLFRRFSLIEAGASAGAGTALRWSLRYFVRAVTGSSKLARLAALSLFWLRFFDGDSQPHQDAACSVYFYGRKSAASITPGDIVAFYREQANRVHRRDSQIQ